MRPPSVREVAEFGLLFPDQVGKEYSCLLIGAFVPLEVSVVVRLLDGSVHSPIV